jgi:hypothetical protein
MGLLGGKLDQKPHLKFLKSGFFVVIICENGELRVILEGFRATRKKIKKWMKT